MSSIQSITISRHIGAAPAQALRGFTHPTLLRDWLCDAASTSPRAGGHILLAWHAGYTTSGVYTRLEQPTLVAFTWLGQGDPGPSLVTVTAEAQGDGARLTLTHSWEGDGPAWEAQAARWTSEWTGALENLQSVVESGVDLRLARRPRLGIYMEEFTPEKARKLGVPVEQGVLLMGTAEGSGAQKAGLQKGDVLVSLNGVPLEELASFGPALKGLKAGDRPVVEYYRAGQKLSIPLELGSFPFPEVPAAGAELAELVKGRFASTLAAMREHLAGLTDVEAGQVPAEGEWSVKEIVAHLILTERDYQTWVANMLNDTVAVEDSLEMSPNVNPRVRSLTARLGSLEALLNELEATLAETVSMLAALPEDFTRERKHLYRRAASWAIEVTTGHYSDEHREQFSAAIAAAKKS